MKLAIISGTTLPGGGPRHIYSLLEKMDRTEWDIIVCTRKDGSYWDKLIALGITPYNLVLRQLSFFTLIKLFKILRKEKEIIRKYPPSTYFNLERTTFKIFFSKFLSSVELS